MLFRSGLPLLVVKLQEWNVASKIKGLGGDDMARFNMPEKKLRRQKGALKRFKLKAGKHQSSEDKAWEYSVLEKKIARR